MRYLKSLKRFAYAFFCLLVIGLPTSCSMKASVASISHSMATKNKYLQGGSMEEVTFYTDHNKDGLKAYSRKGILYKHPKAHAVVLVCHGFMCNKFDIGFMHRFLFPEYHVFIFDFRAHGENVEPEQCCTFGRDEAYDVLGAVDYIKSRSDLKNLPLIAYGFSMGAVAAIEAAALATTTNKTKKTSLFDAMILDCPYDSSENVLKRALSNLKITVFGYTIDLPGIKLLERYAFNSYVQSLLKAILKTISQLDATATNTYIYPVNPVESVKKVSIPCLFIHCYNDEKVSVQSAKNVFHNAGGYKRLWITQGRRHFDSFFYSPDKYCYKINRFIKQVLNGEIDRKSIKQKILSDVKLQGGIL